MASNVRIGIIDRVGRDNEGTAKSVLTIQYYLPHHPVENKRPANLLPSSSVACKGPEDFVLDLQGVWRILRTARIPMCVKTRYSRSSYTPLPALATSFPRARRPLGEILCQWRRQRRPVVQKVQSNPAEHRGPEQTRRRMDITHKAPHKRSMADITHKAAQEV